MKPMKCIKTIICSCLLKKTSVLLKGDRHSDSVFSHLSISTLITCRQRAHGGWYGSTTGNTFFSLISVPLFKFLRISIWMFSICIFFFTHAVPLLVVYIIEIVLLKTEYMVELIIVILMYYGVLILFFKTLITRYIFFS